jgi:hypothetical protein
MSVILGKRQQLYPNLQVCVLIVFRRKSAKQPVGFVYLQITVPELRDGFGLNLICKTYTEFHQILFLVLFGSR